MTVIAGRNRPELREDFNVSKHRITVWPPE